MKVDQKPCSTCPYRKDVPSGVWAHDEYEKLRDYDEGAYPPALSLFLCHHSQFTGEETACRGWLTVASESVAVRLAMMNGTVTGEQVYAEVGVDLYATGNEAADAGQERISDPDAAAMRAAAKLAAKRYRSTP